MPILALLPTLFNYEKSRTMEGRVATDRAQNYQHNRVFTNLLKMELLPTLALTSGKFWL